MTPLTLEPGVRADSDPVTRDGAWPFACPECLGELRGEDVGARCPEHGLFPFEGGIARFLTQERVRHYARFVSEYHAVRRAEGRGGEDAWYYRALPFRDSTGTLAGQWRIRAGSYRALIGRVIGPLEARRTTPLDVLDLGAGNGWLSYRLSLRGHRVAAVDLGDDDRDGLGAHRWYEDAGRRPFTSVQAEFDRLPLSAGCADLVVFNASLHYSTDIAVTLAEALRVLRPDGRVVVLDSPVYRAAEGGRRMVEERESAFRARYGFASDALASENWFTAERLHEVAAGLGLHWRVHVPWHGVRWALRPWLAQARRQRERSSFWLMEGERSAEDASAPVRRREGPLAEVQRAGLRLRHQVLGRNRQSRVVAETVAGLRLEIRPGVFSPRVFRTGEYLARFVAQGVVSEGSAVLDLGTGSGVLALAAAARAARVVAVDLSPEAVRCATDNARANGLADKVEVREGDLFAPLGADERFDLLLFNPPFYRGVPRSAAHAAWRSVDVPERFARGLGAHLTAAGRALVVLSSDCDVEGWLRPSREQGLAVRLVSQRDLGNEVLLLYRIAPPSRPDRVGARAWR